MQKITDVSPLEVVSASRYHGGLGEVLNRDEWGNFARNHLAITDPEDRLIAGIYSNPPVIARLVVNRYGDREGDYAGDFLMNVEDISKPPGRRVRNMQPGMMLVKLALSPFNSREGSDTVRPKDYYVSPRGILLPTSRLRWFLSGTEEGYFPVQNNETEPTEPYHGDLAGIVPSSTLPVLAGQ